MTLTQDDVSMGDVLIWQSPYDNTNGHNLILRYEVTPYTDNQGIRAAGSNAVWGRVIEVIDSPIYSAPSTWMGRTYVFYLNESERAGDALYDLIMDNTGGSNA